ncbi:unnamed protein product (macronuclear) [Paramecium tetraurelia]|uniref:RING-type domain-containing protein n=1 Tax=Paramecium tetraurelia TaxID=5888 RepID=A0EBC1_PARTE|nr:uncharacterized protein GSPATT00025322001 [Paramecium tetraurelia]CAK92588.1 unnamed protein product [Paramecium tetraurelia]|eukprot:XP_001459985.1 hypothetical protein (macronuclear) [Paramecium tetraurelia strain d4-2]
MKNTFALALLLLITFEVSCLSVSTTEEKPSFKLSFPKTTNSSTTFYMDFSNTFEYYAVELNQTSPGNAEIVFLYMESKPPSVQDGELIYDDMDYDSYAQKKSEHFLLVSNPLEKIYFTIFTNISISYDIIVSGSHEKLCPKGCNQNGQCINGECKCNKPFIGRDCSVLAIEIEKDKMFGIGAPEEQFYFFYEQDGSQQLRLEISTEQLDSVYVYLLVPDLIYIPTPSVYNQGANITIGQPFSVMINQRNSRRDDDDGEDSIPDKLVLLVQGKSFEINLETISDDRSKKSRLIIIIVCSIAGSLLLCSIGFCSRRAFLKRQREKQTPATPNIDLEIKEKELEIPAYQEQTQKLYNDALEIISNKDLQDGQDNCGICLESLKTAKVICKIQCSHVFHGSCIETWLKKNSYCPFCRFDLKIKAIKENNDEELIPEL